MKVAINHVYIVYECPLNDNLDGRIHGVYINRHEAERKKFKLLFVKKNVINKDRGWLCVLKKPIKGRNDPSFAYLTSF